MCKIFGIKSINWIERGEIQYLTYHKNVKISNWKKDSASCIANDLLDSSRLIHYELKIIPFSIDTTTL